MAWKGNSDDPCHQHKVQTQILEYTSQSLDILKQARKLLATLVRNYESLTHSLTGVKCRATSVAKKLVVFVNDELIEA